MTSLKGLIMLCPSMQDAETHFFSFIIVSHSFGQMNAQQITSVDVDEAIISSKDCHTSFPSLDQSKRKPCAIDNCSTTTKKVYVSHARQPKSCLSHITSKIKSEVWFEVDEYDHPVENIHSYPAVPPELVPELFWSRAELQVSIVNQMLLARGGFKKFPGLYEIRYSLHSLDTKHFGVN